MNLDIMGRCYVRSPETAEGNIRFLLRGAVVLI